MLYVNQTNCTARKDLGKSLVLQYYAGHAAWGGGTPLSGPYSYVRPQRVVFNCFGPK